MLLERRANKVDDHFVFLMKCCVHKRRTNHGVLALTISEKRTPPYGSLLIAIILSGLGTPILKALVDRGGHDGDLFSDAISYCNVLFVGNLCSAGIVLLYFGSRRIIRQISKITRSRWKSLLSNTLLANVLAPTLLIYALEASADTTTVILLLQTDSVFFAVVAWVMFGDEIPAASLIGLGLIGVGVLVLGVLPGSEPFGRVHLFTLAAALARSLGSAMARRTLEDRKILPAFLVLRNLIGAAVFFLLALQMFGAGHFADAFSPGLWKLMIVYAALVVVLGQVTWYRAIAGLPGHVVSGWNTLVPIVALFFAWLLVGDVPTSVQWLSTVIVVTGLMLTQIHRSAGTKEPESTDEPPRRAFTGG